MTDHRPPGRVSSSASAGERNPPAESAGGLRIFEPNPTYEVRVRPAVEADLPAVLVIYAQPGVDDGGAPPAVVENVAPAHRRNGIGHAMLRAAFTRARERGCYKLALSAHMKRARSYAFCEALGMERHGYSFLIDPREPAEASPSWLGLSALVGSIRSTPIDDAELGQARGPMPATPSFDAAPQDADARQKAGHDAEGAAGSGARA